MDRQPQASQPADQVDESASTADAQPQETESGWFRRTIDALTGRSRPEPEDEPSDEAAAAATEEQANPDQVTLGKAELERLIQAETDRRAARARQPTRAQQREAEKQLLEENPWEAADKRRQELEAEETAERQRESLFSVVQVADKAMLDPVLTRLPESEWRALLTENQDALTSFEGRATLVTKAVERIEARAYEKAKVDLRSNKAFRKELLAELRGGIPEPELVQPGARSSGANGHVSENGAMNSAIRRAARTALLARDRDEDDADLDDDD